MENRHWWREAGRGPGLGRVRIVLVTVLRLTGPGRAEIRTPEKDGWQRTAGIYGHRDARKLTKPCRATTPRATWTQVSDWSSSRLDDISAFEVGQTLDADTFAAGRPDRRHAG